MSTEYKVEVEVKKTKTISFRKNEARSDRPWDWHDGDDIESSEYFNSFEDAYKDAQRVVDA